MERQKLLRSAQNKIFDIFPTVKFASLSALSISNWHCRKIRWAIFLYSFPILTLEVKNLNQSHLNSPWGSKELRHLSQLNWFEMLGSGCCHAEEKGNSFLWDWKSWRLTLCSLFYWTNILIFQHWTLQSNTPSFLGCQNSEKYFRWQHLKRYTTHFSKANFPIAITDMYHTAKFSLILENSAFNRGMDILTIKSKSCLDIAKYPTTHLGIPCLNYNF